MWENVNLFMRSRNHVCVVKEVFRYGKENYGSSKITITGR